MHANFSEPLKISVITVVFNNCHTLEDTIHSVASQDYHNLEYIIVDGNSTDGTKDIILAHQDKIDCWISEPDRGIYDAMNKGLALATGDFIVFLNADDFYTHSQVISHVAACLTEKKADALYADLVYVDKTKNHIRRFWKSGSYRPGAFLWGWMPPHPTFFVRKNCYDRHGYFNSSFKQAADYELMLRFIHKIGIVPAYLPEVIVKMRVGGQSNASLKNRLIAFQEDHRAWKTNGLQPYFFTILFKSLRKIPQFFGTAARLFS